MGCSKSSSKREVYSNTIFPREKSQINNITLHQKQQRKKNKQNAKLEEEIISIRAEINEIEMRKMIAKINKSKSIKRKNDTKERLDSTGFKWLVSLCVNRKKINCYKVRILQNVFKWNLFPKQLIFFRPPRSQFKSQQISAISKIQKFSKNKILLDSIMMSYSMIYHQMSL